MIYLSLLNLVLVLSQGEILETPQAIPTPYSPEATTPDSALTWQAVALGERLIAGLLLLLAAPLLLIAVVVTAALSRQSPLIAHRRVGRHGCEIWVLKLRTMWQRNKAWPISFRFLERLPDRPVPEVKAIRDDRVSSRFALFCRRYSIDELPQLWQVLVGEMALVGPRPLTAVELINHYASLQTALLRVKPGLTGLWQVRGRNRLTYRQRRKLDQFMLRRWSLRLYLRILAATVPSVVFGRGAH